ncbi:MAG TPA: CDP-alcohol phosphatidyltransferase family protein [Gammaproteobacteria bacterium]|nr:CDP-diacylglycerol--glycerol-3-phosphate 3-phosphatidyltransferase [Gammaproteobacteria bacterium]HBF07739.1 CDP-alcohol phosphatidyltransferase family protein [Gammaproteobacteria bacterium]HCK91665.1 CDP-alcohol phosphatidyltransferase family protein [Gammaproteobacteria bacterium]
MTEPQNRRPLKVRSLRIMQAVARKLCAAGLTPNQISIASVIFAILASICISNLSKGENASAWLMPIIAALFIQCRLLCNLFDGMVAVEGGRGTKSGELFNDIPDRIADAVLLVSVGYATAPLFLADILGWICALLAVMTAYIRTLATAIGAPTRFIGPMAKQHRMAILTIALIFTALESMYTNAFYALYIALIIIMLGCCATVWRRARAAYLYLENM